MPGLVLRLTWCWGPGVLLCQLPLLPLLLPAGLARLLEEVLDGLVRHGRHPESCTCGCGSRWKPPRPPQRSCLQGWRILVAFLMWPHSAV